MRIYSMTATFGVLEHATLTLEPGLNIIQAPNEWGKSTWCAFLAAMLYGIDSRVHSATKAGLADKTRYEPWSGQPMSGRIDLNWNGRDITIERRSTKRAAFREFRAYETHSGLTVGALTGENCGQVLLGVEKEVFLRSGFIRFSDMPVTPNEALRRRLNALVTTGDESGAADRLYDQLAKLRNECRANKSKGLLPQAEAQRDLLLEKLDRLTALQAEAKTLAARQRALESEHGTLLARQEARDQTRQEQLSRLRQLQQARAETEAGLQALPEPSVPEPFQSLSPEAGARQARTDCKVYGQACREQQGTLRAVLVLLPALLGLLCLLIPHWIVRCAGLAALLAGILLFTARQSRQKRAAATVNALREKYGGLPPEEWEQHIRTLLTEQAEYRSRLPAYERKLSNTDRAIGQLTQTLAETPAAPDPRIGELEQLLRQHNLLRGRCQGQIEALGDEAQLRSQLEQVEGRISKLRRTLDALALAQKTLSDASARLQSRFTPRITRRASDLFGRITDGRYRRLSLTEDLSLHTCTESEDTLRSILWRSDGTADQLYLALRLAVAAELMPDAPLVLDDALVRFDDTRLKAAMDVLREEADQKQVLLFTCQSREKNML